MKEQLERAEQGVAALLAERNDRWYPTFHIAAKAGQFEDDFGELAVHIYKLPAPAK